MPVAVMTGSTPTTYARWAPGSVPSTRSGAVALTAWPAHLGRAELLASAATINVDPTLRRGGQHGADAKSVAVVLSKLAKSGHRLR